MKLPKDLEDLILDYYWSHRTFLLHRRCFRQLQFCRFFTEVQTFNQIYYTISVNVEEHLHVDFNERLDAASTNVTFPAR